MSCRLWQLDNEVHADSVPWSRWNRKSVELSGRRTSEWFGLKAHVTGGDVPANIPWHLWPPVVPRHYFQCLPSATVTSQPRVVRKRNNMMTEIGGVWNIDLASEIQKSIGQGPLCRLNGASWWTLQFLRSPRHWFLFLPICVPFHISFRIPCSSPAASKPSNAQTMKKFGVRRTMLSLSSEPVPWSDRWDRVSVFPMLLPGWWCMMKSIWAKSRDHLACLRLSFLAVIKYWRFLWSVQISQRCSAPSTKCLHSSNCYDTLFTFTFTLNTWTLLDLIL